MTASPERSIDPTLELVVRSEAWAVFRRFPGDAMPLDDLMGFGYIGLVEARDRYDPKRGVNFEAFARHRVRGAIYDGVRQMGFLSRADYRWLQDQIIAHEAVGGPKATPRSGPNPEDDAEVLYTAVLDLATAFLVADAKQAQEDTPERAVADRADMARVTAALALLTEEEQALLTAVYDLKETGDSGAALARRLGIARSSVTRRHKAILSRLRRMLLVEPET